MDGFLYIPTLFNLYIGMKYTNDCWERHIFVGPCDEKITPCSGHGECTLDPDDSYDGRNCNCTVWYTGLVKNVLIRFITNVLYNCTT